MSTYGPLFVCFVKKELFCFETSGTALKFKEFRRVQFAQIDFSQSDSDGHFCKNVDVIGDDTEV